MDVRGSDTMCNCQAAYSDQGRILQKQFGYKVQELDLKPRPKDKICIYAPLPFRFSRMVDFCRKNLASIQMAYHFNLVPIGSTNSINRCNIINTSILSQLKKSAQRYMYAMIQHNYHKILKLSLQNTLEASTIYIFIYKRNSHAIT